MITSTTSVQINWMIAFLATFAFLDCASSSMGPSKDQTPDPALHYELGILNGIIYDGLGMAPVEADILISGDSIAFIGAVDTGGITCHRWISAEGKQVSPGFIDLHAHGDPLGTVPFDNFLAMGVTTVVLGQDGSSPINQDNRSAGEYIHLLENGELLVNVAMMAGHGSLRRQVGVPDGRPANESERLKMAQILAANLEDGCYGMSSGLEYVPGMYADSLEMEALARVIGTHDGVLMSHIRTEDRDEIAGALAELSWNNPYCRTHVSHLKVTYGEQIDQAYGILKVIGSQSETGHPMTAEVYPYTASFTGIGIVFPSWAKTPATFAQAKRTRESELRTFLRDKIIQRNGPEATLFGTGPFAGKTLAEVSTSSGQDYVDILMKMGPFGASGAYFVMNQDLQDIFITHPSIAIGSDGSPTMRHPRGYGSFARIIQKYVVEQESVSLPIATQKMTGLSAQILNVSDRGQLTVGYKADLLIFNAAQVREHATWSEPHNLAEGFDLIIINGKVVKEGTNVLVRDAGKALRK